MAKFKKGDYIRHRKMIGFIHGVIQGESDGTYKVLTPEGLIKSPHIALIDSGWVKDENKTVDLILKKYEQTPI